ncbi:hypothetical protein BN1051_02298 [Arthrobacter saudimassiliensis]|uniref:CobQ/CobB/MinD/ParA nucleotide binding domain protein n=1 Tax=Arthrobacter saudimassiliensis TaxID=1461584 RepID=A0A078MNX1_9MICC|nr:hypothetical protein BN1051_02298 [Arthrobacter saudimassiliensis]
MRETSPEYDAAHEPLTRRRRREAEGVEGTGSSPREAMAAAEQPTDEAPWRERADALDGTPDALGLYAGIGGQVDHAPAAGPVTAPVPPRQPPANRMPGAAGRLEASQGQVTEWADLQQEWSDTAAELPATRREARRRASFLDTQAPTPPAARGLRGVLAGLGLKLGPSQAELEERHDTSVVSRHWPGPRTISVVNGKGGANKTPTTVMLAAVFARNGGGPVLAWDNNETRGTLGWRTEQGPHESTVMDLLPQTGELLSPSAQSALLARFVHHQTEDKFDVLRSKPDVLASEQKITAADFDALHEVASKYFRLNIVDSGNDESAERWLRMIDHTDQLVIATTTMEEHAEAGALLLEALQARGGHYAMLAEQSVVIVSQADRNGGTAQADAVAAGFAPLARAAVTIPYDPALRKGQIRWSGLHPRTRRAWLAAAAAVAEGL